MTEKMVEWTMDLVRVIESGGGGGGGKRMTLGLRVFCCRLCLAG